MIQKITPFLWFDNKAEEAVNFYVSIFKDSKIVSITRYPTEYQIGPTPGMEGKILTAVFELEGQRFMALDGGPAFKFTPAISMYIECSDQEEVDYYWGKLSADPKFEQCGWVQDKYGVSWQIIPKRLEELTNDPDKEKARRVTEAMLKMKKIIISELEAAAEKK